MTESRYLQAVVSRLGRLLECGELQMAISCFGNGLPVSICVQRINQAKMERNG